MNIAIIPARGNSKRLEKKNLQHINGKPLIYYALIACFKSKFIDDVFVSSENQEILSYSKKIGASIIKRPRYLSADNVPKQKVVVNALKAIKKKYEYVFSIQANSPQISYRDLDKAFIKLKKNKRSELISINHKLEQNAAFRIMKYNYAFQKTLSTGICVYKTNYIDVHYKQDLLKVKKLMSSG